MKEELIIVVSIFWAITGVYGAYLGTWNTKTHSERFYLIFRGQFKYNPSQLLLLALIGAIGGPIVYIMCRINYHQWKIRNSSRE